MNKINMKIHKIENGSVVVSFSTDQSKLPVEQYATLSFQPEHIDFNNIDELLREIAKRGIHTAKAQLIKEQFDINQLQSFVGQTFSYSIDELYVPPQSPTIRSDKVTDLVNS